MLRNPRNSNQICWECDFAKVAHGRARPPCFFVRFHSIVSCSWPSQLFLGWHCDPGSQSEIESGSKLERDKHRASFAFARPAGRESGTVANSLVPAPFLVTQISGSPCSIRRPRWNSICPPIDQRSAVTRNSGSACVTHWPRPPVSTCLASPPRAAVPGRFFGAAPLWKFESATHDLLCPPVPYCQWEAPISAYRRLEPQTACLADLSAQCQLRK